MRKRFAATRNGGRGIAIAMCTDEWRLMHLSRNFVENGK